MFWDPLEFCIAVGVMGFGIITGAFLMGGIGAAAVLAAARYLKRGVKRGATQHLIWALGLQADNALRRFFPAAWTNDFHD